MDKLQWTNSHGLTQWTLLLTKLVHCYLSMAVRPLAACPWLLVHCPWWSLDDVSGDGVIEENALVCESQVVAVFGQQVLFHKALDGFPGIVS